MLFATAMVIGLALASVLLYHLSALSMTRLRYLRGRSRYLALTGICVLFVVLSGCSTTQTSSPAQTGSTQNGGNKVKTPASTATVSVAAVPSTPSLDDWPTYHRDNMRTGYIDNESDPQSLAVSWKRALDGAVYAEPLIVKGHIIVATEGDSLYSLDPATGKTLWHTNVGTPVPQHTLPCGDIDPLGITGTPAYDPATNLVFAVAEITGPAHMLVGVDADTGQVKLRRSVDFPNNSDPAAMQERAALAVNNGMVYFTYGGLAGDCGNYHGMVIGAQTNGQGPLATFQVPTPREGGIWTPPGPVIDTSGNLYVSVGNGETTQGNWDHSDSVLRFSPQVQLEDGFAPTQWQQDNARDADLGSMSPVLLPNNLVFSAGKSGLGYLLRANALRGVGGQLQETSVCRSFGGAATAELQIFLPCTNGVMQVQIVGGNQIAKGWQAPKAANGTPIIGGHTVYTVDYKGGVLYALNSDDGSVRATVPIGATSRFATPTLASNSIFVGTMHGIVAITKS